MAYINQFCCLPNNHNHSVVYPTNIFITHGLLVSWAALLQAGGGVQVGSICCILEPRLEEQAIQGKLFSWEVTEMTEGKSIHMSTFQISACILSNHIPLGKARYVVQFCINGLENSTLPTGRGGK